MKTKHTPGPWVVFDDPGFLGLVVGSKDANVALICESGHGRGGDIVANARLIAAAPDLLEACFAALSVLGLANVPDGTTHTAKEAFDKTLSAITKAKGEE